MSLNKNQLIFASAHTLRQCSSVKINLVLPPAPLPRPFFWPHVLGNLWRKWKIAVQLLVAM